MTSVTNVVQLTRYNLCHCAVEPWSVQTSHREQNKPQYRCQDCQNSHRVRGTSARSLVGLLFGLLELAGLPWWSLWGKMNIVRTSKEGITWLNISLWRKELMTYFPQLCLSGIREYRKGSRPSVSPSIHLDVLPHAFSMKAGGHLGFFKMLKDTWRVPRHFPIEDMSEKQNMQKRFILTSPRRWPP